MGATNATLSSIANVLRVDQRRAIQVESATLDADKEGQNDILVQIAVWERIHHLVVGARHAHLGLLAGPGLLLSLQIQKLGLDVVERLNFL